MNSVNLVGILQDKVDEHYRKIKVALPTYCDDARTEIELYVRYWEPSKHSYFTSIKTGSQVSIQGRLDVDEKFGTIVIAELVEVLRKPL